MQLHHPSKFSPQNSTVVCFTCGKMFNAQEGIVFEGHINLIGKPPQWGMRLVCHITCLLENIAVLGSA